MSYEADEIDRDRLALDYGQRWIGGVCAGFATCFDIDPAIVRVGLVVTGLFFPKIVVAAYLIAWLVLDRREPRPQD
ncbi:MAG: PspC domain-containing protein [Gammaproteobacteria bacterium]|nr:PspC domain-containing protein [Gammaproteobacteria bacterium]